MRDLAIVVRVITGWDLAVVVVDWNMVDEVVSGLDTSGYELGVVVGTFLNPGFKRKMKK